MGLFALVHIRLCFVLYCLLACVIAVLWFQTLLNLSKIINDIVGKGSLKVFSFAISIGHTAGLCPRISPHLNVKNGVADHQSFGRLQSKMMQSVEHWLSIWLCILNVVSPKNQTNIGL